MKFLLVTLGSGGDVHPFIALGRELVSRGHEVRLAVNEMMAPKLEGTGIGHVPLGEPWSPEDLRDYPGLLDPKRGPTVVFRDLVLPMIPDVYIVTKAQLDEWRPDLVASHHIALGVPWACRERKERVPWASILLSPLSWMSSVDPNVYPPMLPRFLRGVEPKLLPLVARWRGDGLLNKVRRELGLPASTKRDIVMSHARSADLHLGLWSPQLRAPAVDDPPRAHIPGFCLWDTDPSVTARPIELERVLSDDAPPILVSIGTAAVHIDPGFFDVIAGAAELLLERGVPNRVVMLTGVREEDRERSWPANVVELPYAPLSSAMPRCALSIIHGGAGSTGQALASGRPFIVVPFCNDQFDYAARCRRLKCASVLPRTKLTAKLLADAIGSVLNNGTMHERASRVAYLETLANGPAGAAELLERAAKRGGSRR